MLRQMQTAMQPKEELIFTMIFFSCVKRYIVLTNKGLSIEFIPSKDQISG